MRTFDQLESLWQASPAPPRDRGALRLICVRRAPGDHSTPDAVQISVQRGLEGDRWRLADDPDREAQVTLMNATVAELVADGEQPLHQAGDNLLVDLDLGADHLPAGTQLRIGDALLVVSGTPHTGCSVFSARFGQDALRWVNWRHWRDRRLRGVNCRVLRGGTVRVGDPIEAVRQRAEDPVAGA